MTIEDDCECNTICPKYQHCICIYHHDEGYCDCTCGPLRILSERAAKRPSHSIINICVKGAELSAVAEFLSRYSEEELFIPAARARTKISLEIKKTTLASVIEHVGLRVGLPG
ncbi:MAG: hypothetical protein EOS46_26435 [Mesorhizobium sp.]|uniref:hypothetical protein n=1 Tax=Mesorhizobium sp. TaxID=1871066 RepID=UPI000FE5ED92|nr:hypothetical protein [Mesorhizobium sp.]RWF42605.1 MAG: hypothetical protein EOS46_26435 [Mesorhizobium sp.]